MNIPATPLHTIIYGGHPNKKYPKKWIFGLTQVTKQVTQKVHLRDPPVCVTLVMDSRVLKATNDKQDRY